MKKLSTGVAALALMAMPATANAQLLEGALGTVIGGAIGSNIAGSGVQDEGTAIGAVVGGLAATSLTGGGLGFERYLGTAIGTGIGGAIGSNLAGSGVKDEGTAIGAVLGGLAGHYVTKKYQNRYDNNYGYNNQYGYQSGYGYNQGYNYGYGAPAYAAPTYYYYTGQNVVETYAAPATYYVPATTNVYYTTQQATVPPHTHTISRSCYNVAPAPRPKKRCR